MAHPAIARVRPPRGRQRWLFRLLRRSHAWGIHDGRARAGCVTAVAAPVHAPAAVLCTAGQNGPSRKEQEEKHDENSREDNPQNFCAFVRSFVAADLTRAQLAIFCIPAP
jgi:hypothetical protein